MERTIGSTTSVTRVLLLCCMYGLAIVKVANGNMGRLVTPPPDIGRPVVANGIVYFLRYIDIPSRCWNPKVSTYAGGGIVRDNRALMRSHNPHVINGNIEIAPSGCVYIEPGTELRFGAGFGMIINGTLISRGSDDPNGRILMTKHVGPDTGSPTGDWPTDARLVEGNTTQDGQLNLVHREKWRGICTNYVNYTKIDAIVTCRQLGFYRGNFTYHSFSKNYTDYMLFEKPGCSGNENSLFDCPGAANIKIGPHICDGQQVIGFQCEGLRAGLALDHWRGLEFYNSSVEAGYHDRNDPDDNVFDNVTLSRVEYTDVWYAGLDTFHGRGAGLYYQRASISASPYVPLFNNVTVKYGAYDAFNLTNIEGDVHIANCTLYRNRGYGIYVQTAVGGVLVNMTNITENWGDGIKMYMSNLTYYDFLTRFPPDEAFCYTPSLSMQTYPIYVYQDILDVNGKVPTRSSCPKTYRTTKGKRVVVHFLDLIRDPTASAEIEIREGNSGGKLIGKYEVTNGSFPQSVTSQSNGLFIRLSYKIPREVIITKKCKTFKPCIRMLLRVTTTKEMDEDFRLIYSEVSDNIGYGVNIQEMRNKVFFNTSEISNNKYGAGIRIYQGAGEVTVNNTLIEGNQGAGINITYSGGLQLMNKTRLIGNHGYGIITEYLLLNRTRVEHEMRLEVVRSEFRLNEWRALRVGNYCRGGNILVNQSYFGYNLDETIEYLSCNISTLKPTNFSVAFNTFEFNMRHSILVRPMVNTIGIITNNTFSNHSMGALLIDNGYDLLISRWYRDFTVNYNIFENTFRDNGGRYAANVRLTQDSPFQKLYFKFNKFIGNSIQDSFMYLNPRSRANAVVVVSSDNIVLQRNWFYNPDSVREVATHLIDPSGDITATENWWGVEVTNKDQLEPIHNSIFDQDDRYNLAQIRYHPVLKTERLYDNVISSNVPRFLWRFARPGNVIGGVLEERDFAAADWTTYRVDRDIFVKPGVSLILGRGVVLEFASSVGMVVHGCIKADGRDRSGTIQFRLSEDPDMLAVENRTATVALLDGLDEYEGRLEVNISGVVGTVCNEGWTEQNSLLACQQLGLTYNPELGSARRRTPSSDGQPILLSWVDCEDIDVDLTECRAVRDGEDQCTHSQDVYLRCQPATWAGITIPATPKDGQSCESQIRHIAIDNPGLLDHATTAYTPALRIDFNFYKISYLTVLSPLQDGVHIKFQHPYTENILEYVNVTSAGGNGIVIRNSRIDVLYSTVTRARKAGFLFDPFFTEYDALLVRNSIYEDKRTYLEDSPQIRIGDRGMIFLLTRPGSGKEDQTYYCQLQVGSTFRVTLQLLDYSPLTEVEEVTVFDGMRSEIGENRHRWRIEDDLIDFPVVSSTSYLTIRLRVKAGVKTGRLSFAVISYNRISPEPDLKTRLRNCTFDGNDQGIVTKHYNNPSNVRMELYHRHKLETFDLERINVFRSVREAMYMPSVTKYNEDYIPSWEEMTIPQKVATIRYTIDQCNFLDNGYGILAEHNHVDFANNVWHWSIGRSRIERCREGGVEIELPRVNEESGGTKVHKVTFKENLLKENKKFAFIISGYYAEVSIENNNFVNNLCRKGLITISGMEKDMKITSNKMESNTGRHVIDLDIISHSEFSRQVSGTMNYNVIKNNRYYPGMKAPGADYSPKTFTIAFRGLQEMNAHNNVLDNPDLGYELVAATTSLSLGNTVDVARNWWGSTSIFRIRQRIFDFDDWNSYSIAAYHPYLTRADVNADPSTDVPIVPPLDLSRLGGRVMNSLSLPYKPTPYVVVSDLTIMPEATMIIAPGTVLHFRANVGILVLGKIQARGLPYNRITLKPLRGDVPPENRGRRAAAFEDLNQVRRKRETAGTMRLRGDGELYEDQGFLEMYNSSTSTWNIMCDSQFNEKTAEVVCRALGKETINVRVRFTHLYDHYIYGKPSFFRKEFWYFSYYCRGDETSLDQCEKRYNYNLLPCIYASNYTFITCGPRNLESGLDYWGNIRFATDSYQEKVRLNQGYDQFESVLEYVDIEGAGMLHGEKVGAIQTTYVTPSFAFLNITKCASNAYDIIAPRDMLKIRNQNLTRNLGFGINVLILNGESSSRESSFSPLLASTIPYNVYGLVDVCKMEKEISLDNRMILYYKYSHVAVDCVKVIRSANPRKTVGIRFLQLNLYQDFFYRNIIEVFDGTTVSRGNLLAELLANSSGSDVLRQYTSSGDTISIHIHASVSFEYYGFIAEVVAMPPTGLTYPDSSFRHVIQHAVIKQNEDGAIQYKNVGEINPSLYIDHCWLEDNGVAILNLTSPPTIDISLQGTLLFDFSHNYVGRNRGGMYLSARTKTIATALRGNISNNVFAYGTHGEALNISGHYYQRLFIYQNYIYNYTTGDFRDVVHIRDVVVNFTYNVIANNVGHYILTAYNNEDPQARQEYTRCGFNDNNATALYESTIKVEQGRPVFHDNYIVNELNDFEIQANRKEDPREKAVNATRNWWGSNRIGYINGKIWDYEDEPLLSRIQYVPAKLDNSSVVDGNCKPGWKLDTGRCYRYMGGALPYAEANQFCKENGGFLAELRGREYFLEYLARLMRAVDEPSLRIWVMSNVKAGHCSALERSYLVLEEDCTRLLYPFICEKDPSLTQPPEVSDYLMAIALGVGIGVGGFIILVILIIIILWFIKSRGREKQRFERAASIRSSIRGSMRSKSQLTMISLGTSRGRLTDFGDDSSMHSYLTKTSHGESVGTARGGIGSVESIQSEPRPATGRTMANLRKKPVRNKGFHHDVPVDEDDGFDDTFDDDDDGEEISEEDIKVSLENAGGPVYNSSHVNHQGQAPRVRNGHIKPVGSPKVAYNYDHDDVEDDDDDDEEDEKKDYHRQSMSSFHSPESPLASPIKGNIFLPRSNNSLTSHPLPTPPPTPPLLSNRSANAPSAAAPQLRRSTPNLYDDVPSEHSSDRRYGNVPGYHQSPQRLPVPPRSTPDLYADVPSETGSDHRYGNVPGYDPHMAQTASHSTPNLYDDVPSETGSNSRYYGNVPGYSTPPQPGPQRPQVVPRTYTPDIYDHAQQHRDSPVPVPRSFQGSPASSVNSRDRPIAPRRPDRPIGSSPAPMMAPSPLVEARPQAAPMIAPSPRVEPPPSRMAPPPYEPGNVQFVPRDNVRFVPRDNVMYLQQQLQTGKHNEDSVETEI